MSRPIKTHALYLVKGELFNRTLCEAYPALGPGAVPVSRDLDEVTCKGCLNRVSA